MASAAVRRAAAAAALAAIPLDLRQGPFARRKRRGVANNPALGILSDAVAALQHPLRIERIDVSFGARET